MSVELTGKCIPITRGGGIYQEHMNEALDRLADGAWVFSFVLHILKFWKNVVHSHVSS